VITIRHINIAAAALLSAVTLGLLWNITHLSRPLTIMVSNFEFDSRKCELRPSASDAILGMERRSDAEADARLIVDGNNIRLSSRVVTASQALFEEQKKVLADAMNCGTSEWCEGNAPDDDYGSAQLPLLAQKRRGENVQLLGCELTESDFHSVSFETIELPRRTPDVFVIFSMVINIASIFLLLRSERRRLSQRA
jgi:hypothetical protein